MEDSINDFEFVTGSTAHLTVPDSLGIYNINQVEPYSDNTSVCPIPPGSPAYSSSMASSPREYSPNLVNGSQNGFPFPYRDDPEEASTPQLLYTSFDGPIDTNNGKCPIGNEEDNDYHSNTSSKRYARKLLIATVISSFFFSLELFGGWIAGSLALLSDSFHLLSDIISFAISLLSIYLAQKPATRSHSYGYHRAEILGALASILLIWILTGYLCVEAYDRIQNPTEVDGPTMCIIASIAAVLHVLGDLISSLGVLISSIVITIDSTKSWVDPLCTFFFSALVMFSTVGILRSSLRVLMEATPLHIDANAVRSDLENIPGTTLTAHLQLHPYDPDTQEEPLRPTDILAKARHMLKKEYGILQVTIQVE
ncbi:7267_t:CDS:2 [Dentiscutata erythropus]|uniref:7267_t:CDS:1 n=1 Tax=Dentiscutata erythropus TaxID=1348616 RepID=A0A9N9BPK5_9GLOM|nr:7267_t:CDS:2 [Dentiscutata erythropus]